MTQSHTDRIAMRKRSPVRITITLPYSTYNALEESSTHEGRSLSNLSAFLLESALKERDAREAQHSHEVERPVLNRLTVSTRRLMVRR
jgi:hypothetical protein